MSTPSIIPGLDLGTTYSCISYYDPATGRVEIIANDMGNRTTPSYVAFTETERLIGNSAKNQVSMNPENTIFDAKRLIGRTFDDPVVQSDMKHWPFKVKRGQQGQPIYEVSYKNEVHDFKSEEISAMVITKMKELVEAKLGFTIKDMVITVPAYFNDAQRQATKDAGTIAGVNVRRIINEPTAAAIAYGLERPDLKSGKEQRILVFDFGGGTQDVSIIELCEGVFEVKSTNGDTHLGGEDLDNRMVDYFVEEFQKKYKKDLRESNRSVRRLRTACERAKQTLSATYETNVEVDSLFEGIDFSMKITRAKFEDLCMDLFKRCLAPVEKVLKDAKLGKSDIDEIVLVGGSTRIPKIQQLLKDFFNGKELNKSINPDEAVAYGAAVQGHLLNGGKMSTDVVLIDVTSLSLGIETAGQMMTTLIPRNHTKPVKKSQVFTTAQHNQPEVTIRIFEGERQFTKDNNLLGQFNLRGIPPAPAGTPQIEVTFDLDSNGILNVFAEDKQSGNKEKIVVTNDRATLSKAEIDRMVADAEKFKEEDEANRLKVEARNQLQSMSMRVQTQLDNAEFKAKVPQDAWDLANDKCKEITAWLNTNQDPSVADCEAKQKELEQAFYPLMSNSAPQGDAPDSGMHGGFDPSAFEKKQEDRCHIEEVD
jgi:heat shock protein 1/8